MPDPKLKVMISSRCRDEFPPNSGRNLSDIRRALKQWIETHPDFSICGENPIEVWINEEEPPFPGDWNSTEVCMAAVDACDILLSISNGNAGGADDTSDLGMCHAELQRGLTFAPSKVRLIELDGEWQWDDDEVERNTRFAEYLRLRNLFRGTKPHNEQDLRQLVHRTIRSSILELAKNGVREAHRGGGPSGQSLDWNRLSFSERKQTMENTLRSILVTRANSEGIDHERGVLVVTELSETPVVFAIHAIPDSLTLAAAKELVGQPFLFDDRFADALSDGRGGPVHLIACFKNATDNQARRMLGFPDATVLTAPFGVYVADNIQKVQFAFIVNCSDEQNIRAGLQMFFEWLQTSGEQSLLASRAQSRARIVTTIAAER